MWIYLFVWKGQLIDKIKVNTISLPLNLNLMIAANMDEVSVFVTKAIFLSIWSNHLCGNNLLLVHNQFLDGLLFSTQILISFLEYLFTSQKLLSLIHILNKLNIIVYSIPWTFLIPVLEHTQKFTCVGNWCTLQYRGIKYFNLVNWSLTQFFI